MKKLHFFIVFLVVFTLISVSCEQKHDAEDADKKSSLYWKQIAEATLAEVSKEDANYKMSSSAFKYETIVDGNKMDDGYDLYVAEGENIFRFSLRSDVWYKTLQPGGWTPSHPVTMGEWVLFSSYRSLHAVLSSLSNLQNIKDLGGEKYSYFQKGMGPDPDTYIFTATDGLLSKIEANEYGGSGFLTYRTFVYTFIYGGQTVTLPSEYILTVKLSSPKNLIINYGILTWDEVEGAKYYSAEIHKDEKLQFRIFRIDSAVLDLHEHTLSYYWTPGTYQISISAIHPTTHINYNSDKTSIEYVYK